MLTFAFMHHPYFVCITFSMPSPHIFTFLMFFFFFFFCVHNKFKAAFTILSVTEDKGGDSLACNRSFVQCEFLVF